MSRSPSGEDAPRPVRFTKRRARAGRPSVQPQAVGRSLDATFRWLKLDEVARSFRACRAFAEAAGPRIGARARGERLRGAILYVRVSSAAWSHELHALKAQLLDKLRATPGGAEVQDLRFQVGPLDEVPAWGPELEPEPHLAPAPAVLDAAERPGLLADAELARSLAEVADPELREELGRLLRRSDRPTRP